jgi:hypothetical protein
MGLLKKKADPISERARALTGEIAALEAQIKNLDTQLNSVAPPPRLRSTALPHGPTTVLHNGHSTPATPSEPIFEDVNHHRLKADTGPDAASAHVNDLGVRKGGLSGFIFRLKNHFHRPPTMNPKLVNYLAAGSIQGLRPMRYEKRVARYRFIFLVVIILIVLLGTWSIFRPH